jgi:hypothetical protein
VSIYTYILNRHSVVENVIHSSKIIQNAILVPETCRHGGESVGIDRHFHCHWQPPVALMTLLLAACVSMRPGSAAGGFQYMAVTMTVNTEGFVLCSWEPSKVHESLSPIVVPMTLLGQFHWPDVQKR